MLLVCVCVCVGLQEGLWFAIVLCIDLLLLFSSYVSYYLRSSWNAWPAHLWNEWCECVPCKWHWPLDNWCQCDRRITLHLIVPGVSWSQASMSKVSWPGFRGSNCRNSPPNFPHVWISAVYLAMCKRVQNLRSMLFHWLDLICSRTRCVQTLKLQQSREAHHWHESCWWLSSSSLTRLSNTSL